MTFKCQKHTAYLVSRRSIADSYCYLASAPLRRILRGTPLQHPTQGYQPFTWTTATSTGKDQVLSEERWVLASINSFHDPSCLLPFRVWILWKDFISIYHDCVSCSTLLCLGIAIFNLLSVNEKSWRRI